MEHGADEPVEEQSHTITTEVEKAVLSTAYVNMEINVNYTEEERALAAIVKSEPASLVKEDDTEDGWKAIAEQQGAQGAPPSAVIGSTNVFARIADRDNIIKIKEELGAIDVGPTVFQNMDTQYITNQIRYNMA